jgi:hypothetical protein
MEPEYTVNGLPLPAALVTLLREGRWVHPGDDRLRALIPFLYGPVDFVRSVAHMRWECDSFLKLFDRLASLGPPSSLLFPGRHRLGRAVERPLLDLDRAVVLAGSRETGDDQWVMLDYRTSGEPRVVANEWVSGAPANDWSSPGLEWREVGATFAAFAQALGLGGGQPAAAECYERIG